MRRHCWLDWLLQGQVITLVPLAVPWFSASRHLSPNTRISPPAQAVHNWLAAVWQSQISTVAPAAVEALSTSRQRPDVLVSRVAHARAHHRVGCLANHGLVDVAPEAVPGVPPHRRSDGRASGRGPGRRLDRHHGQQRERSGRGQLTDPLAWSCVRRRRFGARPDRRRIPQGFLAARSPPGRRRPAGRQPWDACAHGFHLFNRAEPTRREGVRPSRRARHTAAATRWRAQQGR